MNDALDVLNAIRGGDHCDWCVYHPPTWLDRKMRFDQIVMDKRPWYERLYSWWRLEAMQAIGIWRIGEWWHHRYHTFPDVDIDLALIDTTFGGMVSYYVVGGVQRLAGTEWSENWRAWPHCNTQAGCWMHLGPSKRYCRCNCRWCRIARRIRHYPFGRIGQRKTRT
jgi:hypothetical protein